MAVLNRTLGRTQTKTAGGLRLGPLLLIVIGVIVVIGLLRIVQTSQATTASFNIQELQQHKVELETEVRQLEAEVAGLSSLARIQREAERLGLVPPKERESVEVNVAWPGADEDRLPTRFAPDEGSEERGQDDAWWQDLLGLIPFF